MTVRTSRKTVAFTRPFSLSGIDGVQPAGTYEVATDEELLPGLSFPAYRRIATLIYLPSRPGKAIPEQVVNVDPLELEAAQDIRALAHPVGAVAGPAVAVQLRRGPNRPESFDMWNSVWKVMPQGLTSPPSSSGRSSIRTGTRS